VLLFEETEDAVVEVELVVLPELLFLADIEWIYSEEYPIPIPTRSIDIIRYDATVLLFIWGFFIGYILLVIFISIGTNPVSGTQLLGFTVFFSKNLYLTHILKIL
jgi:hypothetical protein